MRTKFNTIAQRITFVMVISMLLTGGFACNKKDYPCPGLGQSNEADMSQFNEDGSPKDSKKRKPKGRINKENGMVNKKNPKKLRAQRKTHI